MTNDEAYKMLRPMSGCKFTVVPIPRTNGEMFVEYEYTPYDPPNYDVESPGVGPGHPAEVALIHVLIGDQLVDADCVLNEELIEFAQDWIAGDRE